MLICTGAAPLLNEPYGAELSDEGWYGQRAEVLQDYGEYCRVRMEYGYEGYILRKHLCRWEYGPGTMQVRSPFMDVMESPSYQGRRRLTLPRGAVVEPQGDEGPWRRLRLAGGGQGYCRAAHLAPMVSPKDMPEEELRQAIVQTALSYLGTPYRWGGRTPAGVDCSGLCHGAYLINGVAIYRNSSIQEGYPVKEIPPDSLAPADLIYFPGHVALYLGEGSYIHATGRAGEDCVRLNSLEPSAPDYRADLAECIACAGSIFPLTS